MSDITKYLSLITTEHKDKDRFVETISISLQAFADVIDLAKNIYGYFNLDSAVGKQLDIIGQWIGITRLLKIPLLNVYFSLDTVGVGLDQGIWKQPYDPETGLTELPDDSYRTLIKAKIIANHWDGTIENAYKAWDFLFEKEGFKILIQDGTPAKVNFFTLEPPTILQGLDYSNFVPDNINNYYITGGMSIIIALIAPYEPPPPPLTYFELDNPDNGLDVGFFDVTPQPTAFPSTDAITLALFKGGYLGLKPAGVKVEYATQSYRGLPMFALDVNNSSYLAGLDKGAWPIITGV